MAELKKPLNGKKYEEIIVEKELFNMGSVYADGMLIESEIRPTWASIFDNVRRTANSVFLGRDLTSSDKIKVDDMEDKATEKANGYYTSVIRKLNPNTDIPKKAYGVKGALVDRNPKYEEIYLPCCYSYDINSAYLSALADGMYPDTDSGDLGPGFVEEGQIGFITIWGLDKEDDKEKNIIIDYTFEGMAHHRFLFSHSKKLQKWAQVQYARIKQADKERGKLEKLSFVKLTGVIRNHNPWMYEYIVRKSAKRIEEILDENSILWNTDGFISLTKREDLEIGVALGQFKVEFSGCPVRYIGTNYAWKDDFGYHSKVRGDPLGEPEQVEYSAIKFLKEGIIIPRSKPKYKAIPIKKGVYVI